MVVGVLVVELDDVVVHVLHGALDLHARHVQLLELHQRHRAGGVLQQRLVHAQRDRRAGPQLALHEVLGEDLAGEVLCHRPLDCYPVAIGCALVAERRRHIRWWERPLEALARTKAGGWYFLNVAMPVDRVLLPLTNGRVSSAIGQQVGLLETVGAKSGEPRPIPLLYLVDGDRIVLIASKAGAAKHPAWLHNLRANPRVSFLAPRGRSGDYVAREAEGPERERLWDEAVRLLRGVHRLPAAGRRAPDPVVVLERAPAETG